MKWNQYTIETTTAAEDYISMTLAELGIDGVQIEDNVPLSKEDQADMFIDFLPELPPDDGTSRVSFFIEDDGEDHTELLVQVKKALEELRGIVDIGSGKITAGQTEDLDWINNWKRFFTSFYIEDILIKPTWEEQKEEDRDRLLIEIDPGISFGTGKHETTQLCIRQLLKYIRAIQAHTSMRSAKGLAQNQTAGLSGNQAAGSPEEAKEAMADDSSGRIRAVPECQTKCPSACPGIKVLDVGCGSGILSIVALKLGAAEVVGTDLDEDCLTSTRNNMEVNHLDPARGTFYLGNLIDDTELLEKVGTEEYDIVVANILADVIIPMAPVIPARLKHGGYFITSGIIDFKEQEVREAIGRTGMEILETNRQGEWVNITARRI